MKNVLLCVLIGALFVSITVSAEVKIKALAKKQWSEAETANYLLISDLPVKKVRIAAEQLERYRAFCKFFLNIKTERLERKNKTVLYLTEKRSTWRQMGLNENSVGIYNLGGAGRNRIFVDVKGLFGKSFGRDSKGRSSVLNALTKELFAEAGFRETFPAWFRTGFAYYLASYSEPKDTIMLGSVEPYKNRLSSIFNSAGAIISFNSKELFARKNAPKRLGLSRNAWLKKVNRYYMQSFLTIHYLYADNDRRGQLVSYLRAIESGHTADKSFEDAFKLSYTQFDRDLRAYLTSSRLSARVMNRDQVLALMTIPSEFSSVTLDEASFFKQFVKDITELGEGSIPSSDKQKFIKEYKSTYPELLETDLVL